MFDTVVGGNADVRPVKLKNPLLTVRVLKELDRPVSDERNLIIVKIVKNR